MATIEQAIEYAKKNPNSDFATELRKRIESGKMNTELQQAGLTQYIPQQEKGYGGRVVESFKDTASNVMSGIKQGSEGYTQGVEDANRATTLKDSLGGVLKSVGGLAKAAIRTVGGVARQAFTPIAEAPGVKQGLEAAGGEVAKIPGVDKLLTLAEKYPESAKTIQDIVDTLTLGVGKTVEQPLKQGVIKAGEKVAEGTSKIAQGTKAVVGDVVPSADRMVNYQVTRALDLTANDVKNIASSTGNEVGEFLANKNLIGVNKETTKKLVDDFYKENYDTVRAEIGKVTKEYIKNDIPRYDEALKELKKQVGETPGLQDVTNEINNLLKKENPSLNDVQRVKELMDDHFSLYKATGDVKESIAKEGLANIRKDLKNFIEKEVKDTTGADIGELNNNVSTSRSISDAITERSTRGLTRSNIRLGDLGAFGIGTAAGGPLVGAAAVFAKKVIESPTVRLRIAKYLDGVSDAKKARLAKILEAGDVPKELEDVTK